MRSHPGSRPVRMMLVRTAAGARKLAREAERPLVLVPTMGALHAGHEALVRRARRLAGPRGTVLVSVFVNPTQFGPTEDYSRYPRTLERDMVLCRRAGATHIFAPGADQMYPPDGQTTWVEEVVLSSGLCGASRPGHFRGVCTVVAKLFGLLDPDSAVFGEKDWQQLAVVRRMVRDLCLRVRIVGCGTVREADGLALSSRNVYLSPEDRLVAPGIFRVLQRAAAAGGTVARIRAQARDGLASLPGARLDYVEIVDAQTLQPLGKVPAPGKGKGKGKGRGRLLAAVWFGKTRLIDNVAFPGRVRS